MNLSPRENLGLEETAQARDIGLAGSHRGGQPAAVIFTLIASRHHDLDVEQRHLVGIESHMRAVGEVGLPELREHRVSANCLNAAWERRPMIHSRQNGERQS
jgi:hypothetical protein